MAKGLSRFFVDSSQVDSVVKGDIKKAGDKAASPPKDKRTRLVEALNDLIVPPDNGNFVPSYGTMKKSAIFPDSDIELMRTALDKSERIMAAGQMPSPEMETVQTPVEAAPPPQQLPDLLFPVYHVSSILYHSPGDWMVWLNGQRVTPKRNKGDVRVTGVSRDFVQLSWKPDNWEYRQQVWNDKTALAPELQRILAAQARTYVNVQGQTVSAVMRANQTWVTVNPIVVEGKHPELEVTVKAESLTDPDTGEKSIFSTKTAKEYIAGMARKTAQKVNENSQKAAEAAMRPAANKAAAAMPANAQPARGIMEGAVMPQTAMPRAAATQFPVTPAAPASLDDILSAVNNAPPAAMPAAPSTPQPQVMP